MKRLSALIAALVLCMAPVLTLAAPGGTYALDELGISLSMPADALVFTRDVAADDPDLAAIDYTRQDMLDLLADSDGYLQAIDPDWEYEIAVTVSKTSYVSMSVMDEQEINDAVASILETYAEDGAEAISCEPYDSGSAVFLKILYTYTEDNYTDFIIEYYTIYNNRGISVVLFSYLGEVTDEQQSLMKDVVDGMQFTAGDPKAESGKANKPFDFSAIGPVVGVAVSVLASVGIKARAQRAKAAKKAKATGTGASEYDRVPPESRSAAPDARSAPAWTDDTAAAQSAKPARRCAVCGEPLAPDTVFCGSCGTRADR